MKNRIADIRNYKAVKLIKEFQTILKIEKTEEKLIKLESWKVKMEAFDINELEQTYLQEQGELLGLDAAINITA